MITVQYRGEYGKLPDQNAGPDDCALCLAVFGDKPDSLTLRELQRLCLGVERRALRAGYLLGAKVFE